MSNEQAENVIAFSGNTMVYESVKRFALRGLNDMIRVLMESVDDALFELSEKVENDRDRNMYFEAMREIRRKRNGIMQSFDEELQQSFSRLINNRSSGQQSAPSDELSLVDQAELEDRLAIDNMISKARPHFEDDLFAVSERLKVVLHRRQILDDLNPLDPKAICDSFHNASAQLDTDIQVKLIFYKLFDKFVMSNLGHFYRELNDYFIKKGVLPEFKAEQERMKQTTRFMANRISRAQQQSGQDTDTANAAQTAAALEGENLLSMLQQVLAPGAMQGGSYDPSLYQPGAGSFDPSVFQPGGGSYDPALFNAGAGSYDPSLFAQSGGTGETPLSGTAGPQNVAYLSALSNLQAGNRGVGIPLESVDPHTMQQQLQQQMVAFREQTAGVGSQDENQIIDIVSMLFDFFFDDEALPDPIKVLIGRLQIPILKVAMLDKGFFNHKKHPARKLLDIISKASLGWSDDALQEQKLVEKLEQVVDFLLLEFDQDIAVFEQALDDFQYFLKQENERIEQATHVLEQQERAREQALQQAQQAAGEFIEGLVERYELSFDVVDFLDGQWKSVLTQTWLTQGEDSNHWKNLKRITTTLVWTLIAKHTEEDKSKLLKTLPALLRALAKGMDLINTDNDVKNAVFQMLVQEHASVVRQTSKNIVTRVDDETIYPEQDMAAAFASAPDSAHDPVDIELGEDETGEIQMVDHEFEQDLTEDTVTDITVSPAREVIHNLEEFTQSVVNGNIFIEEEIVMDSTPTTELQESWDEANDDALQQVQELALGAWIEFHDNDGKSLNAKLSWKSNITGKYVFVNRHGDKVKTMTRNGLAAAFRSGSAQVIESVSVFDRAINSLMSSIRH